MKPFLPCLLLACTPVVGCASAPPPEPSDAQSLVQRMAVAGDAGDWEVYVDCLLPEDRPVLMLGIAANMPGVLEPEQVVRLEEILQGHEMPTAAVIQSFRGGTEERRAIAAKWAGGVDHAALLAELTEIFGRKKVPLPPITGDIGEGEAAGEMVVVKLEVGQCWCVNRDGRWYLSLLDRPDGSS